MDFACILTDIDINQISLFIYTYMNDDVNSRPYLLGFPSV